jgi:hypothetical protein
VKRSPCLALAALSALLAAAPVHAEAPLPYVRLAIGGGQLRMEALNAAMLSQQDAIRAAGGQADFSRAKGTFGPEAAAGLWLYPWLRAGLTFGYQRSRIDNTADGPNGFAYHDHYRFAATDAGGEAAVRIVRCAGLMFGGQIALTRAQVSNDYGVADASGSLHATTKSDYTRTTWGVFVGLDQTNEQGTAGFIRAGYRFRDLGSIPGVQTRDDGSNITSGPVMTVPLDFSGWFASVGIGFDARR